MVWLNSIIAVLIVSSTLAAGSINRDVQTYITKVSEHRAAINNLNNSLQNIESLYGSGIAWELRKALGTKSDAELEELSRNLSGDIDALVKQVKLRVDYPFFSYLFSEDGLSEDDAFYRLLKEPILPQVVGFTVFMMQTVLAFVIILGVVKIGLPLLPYYFMFRYAPQWFMTIVWLRFLRVI